MIAIFVFVFSEPRLTIGPIESPQTTNTEMFWVMQEVCSESNIIKRVKVIKRFIQIASK